MPHLRITSVGAALVAISVAAAGGCQLVGGFGDFSGTGGDATGSGGRGDATSTHTSSSSRTSSTHSGSSSGTGGEGGAGGSGGAGDCTDASQCDDEDPCTTDTCKQHVCHHVEVEDGPTPGVTQLVGDCLTDACVGGAHMMIADDSDAPDDGNACTTDSCKDGVKVFKPVPNSPVIACGPDPQKCVDGMCVGCTVGDASTCAGANDCQSFTCEGTGAVGSCIVHYADDGTAIPAQTAGDCKKVVCDGVGGTRVANDLNDVKNDNNPCTDDKCTGAGTPTNQPSASGTVCPSGFCDGASHCLQCTQDNQCGGGLRVCFNGTCCTPDTTICTAQGRCGGTVTNNCGQPRTCTINDCGSPSSNYECTSANTCCPKPAIAQACGPQCGGIRTDTCGTARDCGANVCPSGLVCSGQQCCMPEPTYVTCNNQCSGQTRINSCGEQIVCSGSAACDNSTLDGRPRVCRQGGGGACCKLSQQFQQVCNNRCDGSSGFDPACGQITCDAATCVAAGRVCDAGGNCF